MADEHRLIATSAIISVGVGTVNSVVKYGRPPSMRFLIGSGVAYLALSALAEGEPEVAKALAIAIASTVVLGQGDGLFSYVNKYGEANTHAGAHDPKNGRHGSTAVDTGNLHAAAVNEPPPAFRSDTLPAMPGIPSTR